MKYRQPNVCQLCRSRKLGCDGKRPSCSQCLLKRRRCPGYTTERIFLHTSATPTSLHRKRIKATALPLGKALSWPLRDIVSLCAQNFVPSEQLAASGTSGPTTPRICGEWVEVLPSLLGSAAGESFLPAAIKALAISIIARGPNGSAPLSDAYKAQYTATRQLRLALYHDGSLGFEFKAAAMMCLFLSEVFLPTSTTGSSVHVDGISRYIQQQKPAFYSSGTPHKLFVGFLPILILHSFLSRTPSFLAQSAWQDVPLTELHALLSKASAIPLVLEQLDRSKLSDLNSSAEGHALSSLLDILDALDERYASFTLSISETLRHQISSDHETVSFPDITTANFLTHYWAFRIICVTRIRKLCTENPALSQTPQVKGKPLPCGNQVGTQLKRFALLILQGTTYLTQKCFGLYGVASVALPFQTAFSYLMSCEELGKDQRQRIAEETVKNVQSSGYQDLLNLGFTAIREALPSRH